MGVVEAVENFDGFDAAVDEVGFRWGKRFQAETDACVGNGGAGAAEGINGVIGGLRFCGAGRDAALSGRPENEYIAAKIGATTRQFSEIVGSRLTDGGVGRSELQTFGAREQPMKAEKRQAAVLGLAPQLAPPFRRYVGDAASKSKRRDFQPLVAKAGNELTDAPMLPTLESLITDRITHNMGIPRP